MLGKTKELEKSINHIDYKRFTEQLSEDIQEAAKSIFQAQISLENALDMNDPDAIREAIEHLNEALLCLDMPVTKNLKRKVRA